MLASFVIASRCLLLLSAVHWWSTKTAWLTSRTTASGKRPPLSRRSFSNALILTFKAAAEERLLPSSIFCIFAEAPSVSVVVISAYVRRCFAKMSSSNGAFVAAFFAEDRPDFETLGRPFSRSWCFLFVPCTVCVCSCARFRLVLFCKRRARRS